MAGHIVTSELEQFVITQVQLTGTILGRSTLLHLHLTQVGGLNLWQKKSFNEVLSKYMSNSIFHIHQKHIAK